MSIANFDGNTFVAFIDISGFKQLMRNERRAWKAIDRLYQYGYNAIKENNQQNDVSVEGLFVSDSGILFVRNRGNRNRENCVDYENTKECLVVLLKVVKAINKKMLEHDFMLTTSIAYGHFKYQERIEFEGIEKNPLYGNAYVSAFLDNEKGKPKIQPGQCRIIRKNLPQDLIQLMENRNNNNDGILRMIQKRNNDTNHFYFYWMVEEPFEIEEFEKKYNDSYNLKYAGMLKALKKGRHERHFR